MRRILLCLPLPPCFLRRCQRTSAAPLGFPQLHLHAGKVIQQLFYPPLVVLLLRLKVCSALLCLLQSLLHFLLPPPVFSLQRLHPLVPLLLHPRSLLLQPLIFLPARRQQLLAPLQLRLHVLGPPLRRLQQDLHLSHPPFHLHPLSIHLCNLRFPSRQRLLAQRQHLPQPVGLSVLLARLALRELAYQRPSDFLLNSFLNGGSDLHCAFTKFLFHEFAQNDSRDL
mmetsp:Transcript_21848/g.72220  ORF Transcript_21848/g.72220 Transcript_21848/m.72220 type:complete len:225 (-) Transcript_21848:1356-2030(-)